MNKIVVTDGSIERRVYGALQRYLDGVTAGELADEMDLGTTNIRAALRRLIDKGCARSTGATSSRVYYPASAVLPITARGSAAKSVEQLVKANRARRKPKYLLEACWPSPVSTALFKHLGKT